MLRTLLAFLRFTLCKIFRVRGHGISILVPAHLTDSQRIKNWLWLERYWKTSLPGAEIIVGEDSEVGRLPFSKSAAVNDAAAKAHGDVFIVVDADVYIPIESVLHCVKEIRRAEKNGKKLWFMPYRKIYRLTEKVSREILSNSHKQPIKPITKDDITNTGLFEGTPISEIGHWYGAMIQIMSRTAFYTVGGWDTRFRGWGGEDHAAMVAMDTLYGPHKIFSGQILHLWHPVTTPNPTDDPKGKKRLWDNQDSHKNNDVLSGRYYWSRNNPKRMRRLVDEFLNSGPVSKEFKNAPPSISY